ncbi:hypothetical protein MBM_09145 [Drepanopeziza brunnea f. sp. 'multigermtubi' MB_m1]|uniref:CBM1 domain-containing protein n=1 Tax=Marssonina brunnea f. sp. multigermtubi (strain MB_m1) TaxID=1072389 RepID=K1WIB6_MARBU|nr:uncharacterized protein MBM_09145 [Drepanopeziza brunnea f. sp. 'multigermtubi' MB_m1]EKD12576.1 hypothetical protein MBM_09145 [Drepanopeziza brunnea f. sp. 'multigermtubi' MB_m1]
MPSMTRSGLVALAASVATVSAHGYVEEITADGVAHEGYIMTTYPYMNPPKDSPAWSETAVDSGYVGSNDFASPDIICHKEAKNAALSIPVAAGGEVSMRWNTWPESHKGPVLWYMANCGGSCTTVDKTTLEFFKIAEAGLEGGVWATDAMMANGLTASVTIPAGIAAGNYVIRHELIALHGAGGEGGAQSYPQCVNLEVTGGGSDNPPGVLGTALYTSTDPGILFSLAESTYPIPGPPVYGGSGSTPPTSPPTTPEPVTPVTPPETDPEKKETEPEKKETAPKTMVTKTRPASVATPAPGGEGEKSTPGGQGTYTPGGQGTSTPGGQGTSTPKGQGKSCKKGKKAKGTSGSTGSTGSTGGGSTGGGSTGGGSTGGGSTGGGSTGGGSTGGTAGLYAQCGGEGYSGPTNCASGTCTKLNDYYMQCL